MKKTLSQILKQAFYEINDYYLQYLTAYAVQFFLLLAAFLFLPPFGIILAFVVSIITSIGMAKYSLQVLNGKKAQVETVASTGKYTFAHIITYVVKTFEILFFGVFLIVPGVIKALQYSQVNFLLAQNEKLTTFESLTESKKLTQNALGKVLMLKLLHMFIAVVLIAFTASIIIITQIFADLSLRLVVTWLVLMSVTLITAVVLPFALISRTILYENLKQVSKYNKTVPQKTFLQEVAQDFITAFSLKKQDHQQNTALPTEKSQTNKKPQNQAQNTQQSKTGKPKNASKGKSKTPSSKNKTPSSKNKTNTPEK